MKTINPFVIGRYEGPDFFCDREIELKRLLNSVDNQRNVTLISHRRLGKTGLIQHLFHFLAKDQEFQCIYIDLMHTSNLEDFIRTFAKSVIGKFDSKTSRLIKTFTNIVKGLRPSINIDPMTGEPSVDIYLQDQRRKISTVDEIFTYLESQDKRMVIAFDEFQQINQYPEKNLEALLRSHIQHMRKASFIFSGSQRRLLMNMFGDTQRPFYQSTEFLDLGKIDKKKYAEFISLHFRSSKRMIEPEAVDLILQLTGVHTFYVQFLCNKLFSSNAKKISPGLVVNALINILKEQEVIYINYKNLMTRQQFKLLKAIASEGLVKRPTSGDFIQKYNLSAASTIQTSLESLTKKEMVMKVNDGYQVYDVFLALWLKRLHSTG